MGHKCKELKMKYWVLGDASATWDGNILLLAQGKDTVLTLTKAQTRKLYQKLSSLYKD